MRLLNCYVLLNAAHVSVKPAKQKTTRPFKAIQRPKSFEVCKVFYVKKCKEFQKPRYLAQLESEEGS